MTPALFLGHGSPLNAIQDTRFARAWRALAASLPRPKAVLMVSAHWMTRGTFLTADERPRTIHDFGGFPEALYNVQYPAPGDPGLAERVRALLGLSAGALSTDWGLDHGAWSVLVHLFPRADVPVVQLSLDMTESPAAHADRARRLAPLRGEGVLVIGSGDVVHNLGRRGAEDGPPFPWAQGFDDAAARAAQAGDLPALTAWERLTPDARLACPTLDHYLPFLYPLALREQGEALSFPVEGFQYQSISLRALRVG